MTEIKFSFWIRHFVWSSEKHQTWNVLSRCPKTSVQWSPRDQVGGIFIRKTSPLQVTRKFGVACSIGHWSACTGAANNKLHLNKANRHHLWQRHAWTSTAHKVLRPETPAEWREEGMLKSAQASQQFWYFHVKCEPCDKEISSLISGFDIFEKRWFFPSRDPSMFCDGVKESRTE